MDAAVAEFAVMEVCLLGTLTGQLRHTSHRLTVALTLLNLILKHLSHILMDVQIVINLLLDEVTHIFINAHPVRRHRGGAELDLRLTLKDGFLDIDGDSRHDTCADVAILVFVEELLDSLGDMFLEGTLMGSALNGVLAIDEGIILLAILVGVREGNLDVVPLEMDDGIEGIAGHTVLQQILQTSAGEDATAVVHNGQPRIQVSIVAEHILHDLIVIGIVLEERIVRLEENVGTVLILRGFRHITYQHATLKDSLAHLPFTIASHLKTAAQGIHGLHTHTVQTDRLLESLRVELSAGVQDANGVDELSLRDASSVVTNRHPKIILDGYLDTVASLHLELVDRVVEHLLQQHIDTVVGLGAVVKLSDIHTWTQTDMLQTRQGADVLVIILHLSILAIDSCLLTPDS